jgi:geranylgeranyl diphosphate synthase type II
MMALEEEMVKIKRKVDSLILKELLPRSDKIAEVDVLYRMMRDYPERPAKGLRPFICTTTCRAFGGKLEDALLTAAAIELFQNWILIHDDLEDGSVMRRGRPALHKLYDWTLAINAGDALHARMWKTLLANKETLGAEKTIKLMDEFSKIVDETTEGQHIELGWVVGKKWDLTPNDYYKMCLKKTAWYTAIGPMRLGAIIAGASRKPLEKLIEIGSKLGVGFQIHDDALNLSGDEKYGKEIADDLLEGKRTLILITALNSCTKDEGERIISVLNKGREEKTIREVKEVLSLIKKYRAIEVASQEAVKLVDEARGMLKRLDWNGDRRYVELLDDVARFSVERNW